MRLASLLIVAAGAADHACAQEAPGQAIVERRVLDDASRLEQAGRVEEAMRALENLLAEHPQSVSALVRLAGLAERSGEPARALPLAEKAVLDDDTGLPSARQVWIRLLASAGLQDSAVNAARRWTDDEPLEPAAYLELSGLYARAGDPEQAIAALQRGRSAIGSDRLFVQELAVLQEQRAAWPAAAAEWQAMLGWGSAGVDAVARRLAEVGPAQTTAVAALRERLSGSGATILERRGGIQLALALGEFAWARSLVLGLVGELPGPAGLEVLRDYVTRARDTGDLAGAAWSAGELADRSRTPDEIRYWVSVSAELAFDSGDRSSARDAFARLRAESQRGSDLYGLALRRLHELTVEDEPDRAERILQEYQALYPEDGQTSMDMAVRTAIVWTRMARLDRADAVVSRADPKDIRQAAQQAAVFGRLEVLGGRPGAARPHLELAAAVPVGDPGIRIDVLGLLALVEEADSTSLAELAVGVGEATANGDVRLLLASVERWAASGARAGESMAAFGARELESAGRREAARSVRMAIVESWPKSAVAPRALLDLARSDRAAAPSRAIGWLERLIVEYPESALAPVARRMLLELRSRPAMAPA